MAVLWRRSKRVLTAVLQCEARSALLPARGTQTPGAHHTTYDGLARYAHGVRHVSAGRVRDAVAFCLPAAIRAPAAYHRRPAAHILAQPTVHRKMMKFTTAPRARRGSCLLPRSERDTNATSFAAKSYFEQAAAEEDRVRGQQTTNGLFVDMALDTGYTLSGPARAWSSPTPMLSCSKRILDDLSHSTYTTSLQDPPPPRCPPPCAFRWLPPCCWC